MKVYKADTRGDGYYYVKEDLEWICEPTDTDPGLTCPTANAIPRNQDGRPVHEEEGP